MAGRLGDILIRKGLITDEQLQSAINSQSNERGMLGMILLRKGLINNDQLGEALGEQFDVPYFEIVPQAINQQLVRLLPESFARERMAVPLGIKDRRLTLGMVAPDDIQTISETELMTGYQVDPVVSLAPEVKAALDRGFDERQVACQTAVDMKLEELANSDIADEEAVDAEVVEATEDDSPVVKLVRAILMGAINVKCSDIHLEPHNPEMRVRYRMDGELQQIMTIPKQTEEPVIARIKVMADMDTTETRRPQDGRVTIESDGRRVNFRVSSIPTVLGEKMVLRLLDEGSKIFDLDTLGFLPRDRARIQTMIDKPHGMILVTGPTGSGKSTTMYAMLQKLNTIDLNIVTVEDPVEFRIAGLNQVHSDNEFGMGFANALKFIMRQDPDVIMVGEIRDHETATTALQAALTGHLLVSTLHTNDAVGCVARLADLGIDQFKIGGALVGALAQRLLRGICKNCKEPIANSEAIRERLAQRFTVPADAVFFRGRGCRKCFNSGYAGRIGIYEVMSITPELADAIERGLPAARLRELALEDGMIELPTAAFTEALAGRTTLEEVLLKT